MLTNETLLIEINRFLERHDMAPSTFGRLFLNNPRFISDLAQDDFSPTLKTVNKIQIRMKNYKPEKGKERKMVNKIVSHEETRQDAIHESIAKKVRPFRAVVLERAIACTLGDRQEAYGQPSDALFLAAEFIRLYKSKAGDKYCAAHDEAMALACLKMARIACGAVGHNDNYVDGAAYFAIAAECQHLHKPSDKSLKQWCEDNGLLNEARLAEVDKKYKAATELGAEDRGMKNPFAPVNRKV